jgi:hypothetical protein
MHSLHVVRRRYRPAVLGNRTDMDKNIDMFNLNYTKARVLKNINIKQKKRSSVNLTLNN